VKEACNNSEKMLKSATVGRHGPTRSAGRRRDAGGPWGSLCFEGFTLDLGRGCLRHEDREIELRPKSFTVLRYLVENAGRLVSKDELIRAAWPNVMKRTLAPDFYAC
jgi:DNA-binding response OmpR family regulator